MTEHSLTYGSEPGEVLARLRDLREFDAPTHGGRVLAYVYDSGMSELDHLASEAAEAARSLNGLDPTTFPSIASFSSANPRVAPAAKGPTTLGRMDSGGNGSSSINSTRIGLVPPFRGALSSLTGAQQKH